MAHRAPVRYRNARVPEHMICIAVAACAHVPAAQGWAEHPPVCQGGGVSYVPCRAHGLWRFTRYRTVKRCAGRYWFQRVCPSRRGGAARNRLRNSVDIAPIAQLSGYSARRPADLRPTTHALIRRWRRRPHIHAARLPSLAQASRTIFPNVLSGRCRNDSVAFRSRTNSPGVLSRSRSRYAGSV